MRIEVIEGSNSHPSERGAVKANAMLTTLPVGFDCDFPSFDSIPKRGGDRHIKRASTVKPIIFVDGEGVNEGEPITVKGATFQPQNYCLLSAVFSTGEYKKIVGKDGTARLRSTQCLDFLLSLPRSYIIIGYGISYDVQMMLHDVPEKYIEHLRQKGYTRWKKYVLTYTPGKCFSVSIIGSKPKRCTTWWDIQGYFQTRFDKAVDAWKVARPDEVAFLTRMKLARGTFTSIDDEVLEYNRVEGVHGIRIFEALRTEWTKLKLPVRRFDGAGSIASAMFSRNKVDSFIRQQRPIPTKAMLAAYIGGRFDFSQQGMVGDTIEYDINSAYPNIARHLPCLTCSAWEYRTTYEKADISLWHVRWSCLDARWAPFPWRDKNGRIRYYASGEGWYYGDEVEAALHFTSGIQILEGYVLPTNCDHQPFQWIDEYYAERQRLKDPNNYNFGEKVLKLGLNSVYGKTAQSKGKAPRFQCLVWAGMITSGTRAMILKAITHAPESIVVTATDAVISKTELPLPIDSAKLGYYEAKHLRALFVVGNGLYSDIDATKLGTRGFDKQALDYSELRKLYDSQPRPFSVQIPYSTFFGIIPALARKRYDIRNTWESGTKSLRVEVPEWKEERDGWLWPRPNPDPSCSAPARIPLNSLRLDAPDIKDFWPTHCDID